MRVVFLLIFFLYCVTANGDVLNHDAIVSEYNSAKKEADLGSDTAMLEVFSIFYKTYPILADRTQEASNYLMKSALAGNASAQFNMGFLQQNGDVFEKNIDNAILWLEKAESNGHQSSSRQLGFAYLEKYYLNEDKIDLYEKSQFWFKKSALKGDTISMRQFALGVLSREKDKESFKVAENWLESAVQNGDVPAMRYLAQYYELRYEVEKDKDYLSKAKALFQRAAELGDDESSAWLLEHLE
ncbi:tetratricopeptide repeat protein [Rheinheimera pacifica]|uniref:tetratricopeptide repeat protein n=1 Tax=Rheinheimera pacifica TaxID=173990 RepID=UPI002EDAC58C